MSPTPARHPATGPTQYTHQARHAPDITAGPRLRAGLVLVPDTDASRNTITA